MRDLRKTFCHRAALLVLAASLSGCAGGRPDAAAPAALTDAPLRFASLDGYKVAYRTAGRGAPAIVFVHGWTCDMSTWSRQFPVFAATHRVIAVDLPGHGLSDKPEIAYSMDFFARAVDAVLKDAGVSRAVLVGHSMGTPVIRQFSRLFPGKTVALVVVDGPLMPYSTDPAVAERFVAPFSGPTGREAQAKMADSMFVGVDASLAEPAKKVMLATPQHVVVSAGRAMFDPAIWTEDPIRVPLLVVLAKSPFWSDAYEASVRRLAPGVQYKVFDGVSHFLMLQKPDELNALLSQFLSGLPKG